MPSKDDQQEIRVPSSKKYFTMLPNIYDDAKLSLYEYRLLAHYARVGNCHESLRTTAARCHMGKSSVDRARRLLADKGWITLGRSEFGTALIQVVDVWHLNTGIYGGTSEERKTRIRELRKMGTVDEIKGLCPTEGQDVP